MDLLLQFGGRIGSQNVSCERSALNFMHVLPRCIFGVEMSSIRGIWQLLIS